MADQPTSILPAAPSGPQEDYRITVARKALIESAEAKGTDRSAFEMWGYLEGTVKTLLAAIDEGNATYADEIHDVAALSVDELIDQAEDNVTAAAKNLDKARRLLDEVKAMKARDGDRS